MKCEKMDDALCQSLIHQSQNDFMQHLCTTSNQFVADLKEIKDFIEES
jgi:hypothetical protein